MTKNNEAIDERMFEGNGELATLEKKIRKAHSLKLIDDVAFGDATLVRKIRNNFAHAKQKLNFDNTKTVALAKQLSTHESATSNQEAIFTATSKVTEQLEKTVRTR
jgi:DNA-binding MltR family transcriptional regulator